MENLHDEVIKGRITGANGSPKYFTEEPFYKMAHLPKLPQIYIDDVLSRHEQVFGYLPPERENRTPIIDKDCLFQHTKFVADGEKEFGWCGATILRFDPMTVLDWHRDTPRKHGLNILINEVDGKSHTFMRERSAGWNYNMTEIPYVIGEPMLLNTGMEHTTYNFHPTKTRYVLTITFSKNPEYKTVKEWLLNYKTTNYND